MATKYTFDANIVSDLHKDAYGFRPHSNFWNRWEAASNDEKQKIWNNFVIIVEHEIAHKCARQELSVAKFNEAVDCIGVRGFVKGLKLADWELADPGMICYIADLPYEMEHHFAEIAKEARKRLEAFSNTEEDARINKMLEK